MAKDEIGEGSRQAQPVKSAKRVMEIFELFDREQRPLSQTEISQLLAYPVASTSALLKSLQAIDYISFDRLSRTYSPTIRVAMLGDWVRADVLKNGKVVVAMKELAEKLGETIYLGMQNDLNAQYIHTEQAGRALKHYLSPGLIRPLTRSAAGIMLLATLTDPQIVKLLARIGDDKAPDTAEADNQLTWERIHKARADGYAYNEGYTSGIAAIALPLPYRANGRSLVLGLGGTISRVKDNCGQIVGEMRAAIGEHLGGVT